MWMIQRKTKQIQTKTNIKIVIQTINNYLLFQYSKYKWKKQNLQQKDGLQNYYSLIQTKKQQFQVFATISIDYTESKIHFQGKLLYNNQPFILQSTPLRMLLINQLNRSVQKQKSYQYIKCNIMTGQLIILSMIRYTKKCFESSIILKQEINKNISKLFQVAVNSMFSCFQQLDIIKNHDKNNIEKFNLYKKIKKHIQFSHYDIGLSQKDNVSNFPTSKKLDKRITTIKKMYKNNENQIQGYQMNQFNSEYFLEQLNVNTFKSRKNLQDTNFILNHIKNVKYLQKQQLMYKTAKCSLSLATLSFQYCLSFDQELVSSPTRNKNNANQTYQQLVVIKSQVGETNFEKINHQREIVKLFNLAYSPNLLRYFQSLDQNSPFKNKLIMEYFPNSMSLANFLQNRKQTLSVQTKIHFLQNITNGLRFLNYFNITHMDLNMNNVLVVDGYLSKIIDFGQSYNKQIIKMKKYMPGFTLPFCPPDVFNKSVFGIEEDMFSLGIILYKLLFNSFPFFASDKLKWNYKYKNYHNLWYFAPQKIQYYGCHKSYELILQFFSKCFDSNSEFRPLPVWGAVLLNQIYTFFTK